MRNNPYRDHLKTGRSQIKRLQTMADRLIAMSKEWGELDGLFESDLDRKAEDILAQKTSIEEQLVEWRNGATGIDEEEYS